jgi:hypothetical protein
MQFTGGAEYVLLSLSNSAIIFQIWFKLAVVHYGEGTRVSGGLTER